jgi:hypothetical protein
MGDVVQRVSERLGDGHGGQAVETARQSDERGARSFGIIAGDEDDAEKGSFGLGHAPATAWRHRNLMRGNARNFANQHAQKHQRPTIGEAEIADHDRRRLRIQQTPDGQAADGDKDCSCRCPRGRFVGYEVVQRNGLFDLNLRSTD